MNVYTYSQNTINGTLKDAKTLIPISDASVYFPQLEKGTTSSENGEFSISNLPNGTYKLIASFIGYASFSKNITIG
jgi:iron complex outermembrane receptor protein